tara:strand:- start:125 stop:745 length:621 start_codon:yes stop_codon:yes gene_type:complete
MNLEYSFFCFESALHEKFCQDLVDYGNQQSAQLALTGDFNEGVESEKDLAKLYKTRNSSVVWMDDPWIYNAIIPYVREANKEANWNFDFELSESCQWTRYSESQHYTWHLDQFKKPHSNPKLINYGLIRKLSVTVSLVDGDTYEGGDLEFDLRNNVDGTENIIKATNARKRGSITVFPSFVWHRVTPVTKGTRYSLVIWSLGKPYV